MAEEDREGTEGACAQCGSAVASSAERSFGFGAGNMLCWGCAIERGGEYEAESDTWSVSPDVAGLADEAYGSSPHEVRRTRT